MYIQQTFDWAGTKPPAIDNGLLYVSADKLYALNAQTGVIKWYTLSSSDYIPAIANGILYTSSSVDGKVSAFNEQTGALLWSKNIGASSDPSVANGIVYVEAPCNLEVLSTSTGALLWTFDKKEKRTKVGTAFITSAKPDHPRAISPPTPNLCG